MATSRTAEYVALYRALESSETSRAPLFRDPLARLFLPGRLSWAVRLARARPLRMALVRYADWRAPGARSSAVGRTRFIDDAVRRGVREGKRQLVLLGAGFDCRAHRLPELADTVVFEVDRAEMQALTRRCLRRAAPGGGVRTDVRYVPTDLGTEDLARRLEAAGWDARQASTFVWEGVTNYLTEDAVGGVLRVVAASARGTTLIFTYVHRGAIDGSLRFEGRDRLLRKVERLGEPWRFGLHPDAVAGFLDRFGLELQEDVGADEYRARDLGSSARDLRGYGFYRIARAAVP